eukprot:23840-Chlamydomonas_euryale.AAC.1
MYPWWGCWTSSSRDVVAKCALLRLCCAATCSGACRARRISAAMARLVAGRNLPGDRGGVRAVPRAAGLPSGCDAGAAYSRPGSLAADLIRVGACDRDRRVSSRHLRHQRAATRACAHASAHTSACRALWHACVLACLCSQIP